MAEKERIVLFADSDLDGIPAAIIFKEALDILKNPAAFVYFPDREKEGYGLNKTALEFLKDKSPGLLITLDCGISNFNEIDMAHQIGFEVIIVDHHEVLERLPEAEIIINPKQEGDSCPFKYLSAAGICYKFIKGLFFEIQKEFRPEDFLELAAIATVFDKVPLEGENQEIVEQGILALNYTKRIGLRELIKKRSLRDIKLETLQEIILPLVSAGVVDHQSEAYHLLIEHSQERAEEIAERLIQGAKEKKMLIDAIFQEIERKSDLFPEIIFEGHREWPLSLAGAIATRICQKYKKPTFVFKILNGESRGSVRTPAGVNSVKLMGYCASFLEGYGGHPQAAGFGVKNENLEKFKSCLIQHLNQARYEENTNLY